MSTTTATTLDMKTMREERNTPTNLNPKKPSSKTMVDNRWQRGGDRCRRRSYYIFSSCSSALSPPRLLLLQLPVAIIMGFFSVEFSVSFGASSCSVNAFSVVHPFSRPQENLLLKPSKSLAAPEGRSVHSRTTPPPSSSLFSSASDEDESSKTRILGKRPPSMLRNEFSRTYRPKSILPISFGDDLDYGGGGDNDNKRNSSSNTKSQTRKRHQRQLGASSHEMTVTATKEECDALAERFGLSRLDSLEADLRIMPCIVQQQLTTGGKASRASLIGSDISSSSSDVVDVEGTIKAHVQHVCVRSGDEFEMDVEFPFYCTVYPVSGNDNILNDNIRNRGGQDDDTMPKKKKKTKKSKRSKNASLKSGSGGSIVVDLNDVFDLQAAIKASEAALEDDDGFGDIDAAAAAIPFEDEAVYCTFPDLTLDVGELVAQSFYTQLDPYPVKDKTEDRYNDNDDDSGDPVELYSITG